MNIKIFFAKERLKYFKHAYFYLFILRQFSYILMISHLLNTHPTFIQKPCECLRFVRRQCCDFNNIICLNASYCSLVCSGIEYGSIIWILYQIGQIQRLNNVQYYLLNHLSHKFRLNHSVNSLGLELGLHSRCPKILEKVNWHVPAFKSRSTTTYVSFHSQSYSFNNPLVVW